MDDEQDPKIEVAPYGTIALFAVARGIFVFQERIEKHLRGMLERNAVLLDIELGLVCIPAESDTT